MPIRINLLAEALAQEDMRRRDPVKRAIYVGVLLVVLSLVWYSYTWLDHMVINTGLNQIKSTIQAHSKDFDEVQNNQKKIGDAQKRLEALQQLNGSSLLQGSLMNALQQAYAPNVQLARLRVDQNYTGTPKSTTPPRPATATEKTTLILEAKDFSPNPGDQVNKYKDILSRLDYFKTRLNQTNGVRLSGPPQQASADGKPYVQFILECRFTDKTQ